MTQDPLIVFTPSGKRGRFPVGTPVLTAARKLGVDLDSVCGGRGVCSKCQIHPSYGEFSKHGLDAQEGALGELTSLELRYDRVKGLKEGHRLGCQARIQGDIVIDVPAESQVHKQVVRKGIDEREVTLNPLVKLYYISVQEPDMHDPSGDLQRVLSALKTTWEIEGLEVDFSVLPSLQRVLRKGKWNVTCGVRLAQAGRPAKLLQVWPELYEGNLYGVAVDIGSTTIAAHICDLQTGAVIASGGVMNPQIRFGEDLMSRVSYAMMNEGGADEMTQAVRGGLNQLVGQLIEQAQCAIDAAVDCVIVCNPVMHHLLLGIDPYELGQAPFALATADQVTLRAQDIGLNLHPAAEIYMLPCIAGHVGADAAAVALSERPDQADALTLVVDVGTNAEILLGNKHKVLACSSPTGPAFEGAQISSGQRAAPGAIERVEIDLESKRPRFKVIGSDLWSDDPAFHENVSKIGVSGICGSGIIELVAEMRLAGLVDGSGLIGSPEQTGSEHCFLDGRTYSYLIYDGQERGGPRITVTNRDIREIQMAKAALYSGARLLMDKMNVTCVDRIMLAGAFGAHISPKHAMVLGMIPDAPLEQVLSVGNAAGTGARIALLNMQARRDIEALVQRVEKIETAIEPRFQEHFVNASHIPNAVDTFSNLEGVVRFPDVLYNAQGAGGSREGRRKRRRSTS